jgi:FkbM family methyltransferase
MSRIDRVVGLARSIAVYHAIPFRQRRMRRFYAGLVQRGDLAFDIGAHAGNRVRALAALGCRVVAVEPQPDFARLLRAWCPRSGRVEIVEAAVSDRAGRASLSISDRTPTVTTLASGWRNARAADDDFAHVRWGRRLDVETTTLDRLIERFGRPRFVKIDVEGAEPAVLAGLSYAVPVVSFEYLLRALDEVRACTARLAAIGPYEFNWSEGESYRLASGAWMPGSELIAALGRAASSRRSGDVYARLPDTPADVPLAR